MLTAVEGSSRYELGIHRAPSTEHRYSTAHTEHCRMVPSSVATSGPSPEPESPLARSYSPSFISTESLGYIIYSAERQPGHSIEPRRSQCQTETKHRSYESRSELPLFYAPSRLEARSPLFHSTEHR